jgi:hypothetical protein
VTATVTAAAAAAERSKSQRENLNYENELAYLRTQLDERKFKEIEFNKEKEKLNKLIDQYKSLNQVHQLF